MCVLFQTCITCKKKCTSQHDYKRHAMFCNGADQWKCPDCRKIFNEYKEARRHDSDCKVLNKHDMSLSFI